MTRVNTDTLLPRVSVWFSEHFHESFVYSLLALSACLFSRGLGQSLPMYAFVCFPRSSSRFTGNFHLNPPTVPLAPLSSFGVLISA